MSATSALGSGFAGACALTLLHETVRKTVPDAPRMDVLGERALVKMMRNADVEPPHGNALYRATLAGDLVSNGLYYSLVGVGNPAGAFVRGALLGLAAGIGAVTLPGPMGLGTSPSRRTNATALMTVGLYLVGGLAAAAAYRALREEPRAVSFAG
jgi:hypothetical protein